MRQKYLSTCPSSLAASDFAKLSLSLIPAFVCAASNAAPDILSSLDEKSVYTLLLPSATQVSFATEIERCLYTLKELGVTAGVDGFIPEFYADLCKAGDVPDVPNRQRTIYQSIATAVS